MSPAPQHGTFAEAFHGARDAEREQRLRGVIVLGTGRCGTSSVTRMFQRSGYFLGAPEDLMQGDTANPRGYFENWRVHGANERVLAELGSEWFDVPPEIGREPRAAPWRRLLGDVVAELLEESGSRPLVLKDPRVTMLMPLWSPLLEGLLQPVLVLRDPLEVALSLERQEGSSVPVALALWELLTRQLLSWLDGRRVTVVPYRRALTQDGLAAALVADASAGLAEELRTNVRPGEAPAALEPGLWRNRADRADRDRWLNPEQLRLAKYLESLAPGAMTLRPPAWSRQASEQARVLARHEYARRRHVRELGARVEQAALDLAERDERLAAQGLELSRQSDRLGDATAQLSELQAQLAGLQSQLDEAAARCREAEQRAAAATRWLGAIQGSVSWRVTEPLRMLKRRLLRRRR